MAAVGAGAPCQLEFKTVDQRCDYLLTLGHWSDCTFIVGLVTKIPAHKLILAMASPVFEAMFYGPLTENNEPVIHITDVQTEAFRVLLRYIYTGYTTDIGSFDMACSLFYGANKYMLPHLAKHCKTYIGSLLGPNNACQAYELACLFDDKPLMDKCIQVIKRNTKEVLNDKSFVNLELSTVIKVFSLECLQVDSELVLFHALVRYNNAQKIRGQISTAVDGGSNAEKLAKSLGQVLVLNVESSSQNSPAAELDSNTTVTPKPTTGKANVKEERPIRAALEKIRFLALGMNRFEVFVSRSGLLTEEETNAMLNYWTFRERGDETIPTGFSLCWEQRRQRLVDVVPNPKPPRKSSSESRDVDSCVADTNFNTREIVNGLLSHDRATLEGAARAARHITSADAADLSNNRSLLVAADVIPALLAALSKPWTGLQIDAVWALANIAYGGEYTNALLKAGAVPQLVGLLLFSGGAVAEQAALTLGYIAGEGDSARRAVVDAGALSALLVHMQPSTPSTQLGNYLWACTKFCQHARDGDDDERYKLISPALPYIRNLLLLDDELVLAQSCLVLSQLTSEWIKNLDLMQVTPELTARVTALLEHDAQRVRATALTALTNMLERLELMDQCLNAGCLEHIIKVFDTGSLSQVEDAARAAAIILSSTPLHIQQALDNRILEPLWQALVITKNSDKCNQYAVNAISSICSKGSASQLGVLTETAALLVPYCRLLTSRYLNLTVMEGLTYLLKNIERSKFKVLCLKLKEIGVPELLKPLVITEDMESNRTIIIQSALEKHNLASEILSQLHN